MGNVERCDKTLPLNEMIYYVRTDPELRRRWRENFDALALEFGLSSEEIEAVQAKDPKRLMDLGVHQYHVPQILRLFFGAAQNTNASPTLECYRRAFPTETEHADAVLARREARRT